MATPEERRQQANDRATAARKSAEIAQAGYDKPLYAAKKRESLAAGNEAMAANEEIKKKLGTGGGMVSNARKTIQTRRDNQMAQMNDIMGDTTKKRPR